MSNTNIQNGKLTNKKVIIIHGYTASPEKNWFPWLKAQLEQQGVVVKVPAMPDPLSPDPQRWQQHLLDAQIELDKDTVVIGHSLGCVTLLRYLASQQQQIGGYLLVSGFTEEQATLPELKAHTDISLDYANLKSLSDKRISIISSNDSIVSPQSSRTLATLLETEVITVENAGHFLDREGFSEFPLILKVLNS
ncbi:serine hydrolase family protein [Providencia stuartii]|uniref:Esterase n=1 Tax=Providencia stuartii TaxID=588 RepID=A0A1S1HRQ5_PROST|nr:MULTISPECIES: alpha/beta hydrolase [Providencia]ELR5114485.1 serine hydrolase family protein [Providencia stuartii]ELR5300035.1 serine hydrolase family protein [Providencia stuartii]MDW7588950.1 alpha/beta hydrolase [Providencia sp. 2023EL-00965]OHT23040.1 esterase [Providencia stuartii]